MFERDVQVAEAELQVGERGENPDAVGADAEVRGERGCLGGMSAALRLLALASLEPGEAGERGGEVGAVAGVPGQSDRFVVLGGRCCPAVSGRVMARGRAAGVARAR